MDSTWLVLPGLIIWVSILLLPWRPWSTRETLDSNSDSIATDLSTVTVLIPARNEQDTIQKTLRSIQAQGNVANIILIDDESDDATVAKVRELAIPNLLILNGKPLPADWSGKLWALEQGSREVRTEYLLLMDADIELRSGTLAALLLKARSGELALISLMAQLRMDNVWEKLLMPPFIYFFKLLYPFALSNSKLKHIAAAAGGCILIRTDVLKAIGGFASIKSVLIDDCNLARKVKDHGGKTWIGMTHSALSHRTYPNLVSIWNMVARTAYTQLHFSPVLLLICSLLMVAAFIMPLISLFFNTGMALFTLLLMWLSYLPTLRYYNLGIFWVITLPLAGILYLIMTWSSALQHYKGDGAEWKNRKYLNRS